jgi:hypothetical protein
MDPAQSLFDTLPLYPPDVVELTLRVGVVAESDHVQIQWSLINATDGVLLGHEALPHRGMTQLPHELNSMMLRAVKALYEVCPPF